MPKRLFTDNREIEICRLYSENQLSSYKLAEQMGCSQPTIRNIIKKNGFKLRSLSEALRGRFGAKSSQWKGGRAHHRSGYVWILKPNHPNVDIRGYVLEHRLIMEKSLERFLNPKEVVHHINGNPSDNRIENLMLFVGTKEHHGWHKKKRRESKLLQKDFCVDS